MPVRYVITTLKPGVNPEDYECWVREYDYKVAKTFPSLISYRAHRITGPIMGAEQAGWSYIERIEVRDVEAYQRDLASPAGQELIRQLYERYLDRPKKGAYRSWGRVGTAAGMRYPFGSIVQSPERSSFFDAMPNR